MTHAAVGVAELTALALGLLTVVLVGPGPLWVRRWSFLFRVPRAAVVLWQAGTIASLVAVVLAALTVAPLIPRSARGPGAVLLVFDVLIVGFALLVCVRLIWALVRVAAQTSARRRRHRAVLDLLGGDADRLALPGLRVLAGRLPLAYCVPGRRDPRVVVSAGALDTLTEPELRAVVEHERAHLRARHDLVLDTFTALHRAFPLLVRSEIPAEQCRLLVEMLADDAAVRQTGPVPLARALVALAGGPVPDAALGAAQLGVSVRIERLAAPPRDDRVLAAAVYLLATALVLGPVLAWLLAGRLL